MDTGNPDWNHKASYMQEKIILASKGLRLVITKREYYLFWRSRQTVSLKLINIPICEPVMFSITTN